MSPVTQVYYISASSVRKLRKKSKKKTYGLGQVLFSTQFRNLKFGFRPGHRVTCYIGGISWLPQNEMGKNLRKNLGY